MTNLEQQLIDRGITADDVTFIVDLVEADQADLARAQAAHLIQLIFLRVERDSAAGCALRRALGFSSEASLSRAAKEFCCSKQYLHDLQSDLEEKLGSLSFLAGHARAHAAQPDRKNSGPAGRAGPSGETPPLR